jgi:hypothetical protein
LEDLNGNYLMRITPASNETYAFMPTHPVRQVLIVGERESLKPWHSA